MKKLIILTACISLSGCSLISDLMPSKWDENQARVLTDIRQEAGSFDCTKNVPTQLDTMEKQIEWFQLYSGYKKADDINKMMGTLQTTIKELETRASSGPISPTYCQLKKTIIVEQADIIGHTIEGSLP